MVQYVMHVLAVNWCELSINRILPFSHFHICVSSHHITSHDKCRSPLACWHVVQFIQLRSPVCHYCLTKPNFGMRTPVGKYFLFTWLYRKRNNFPEKKYPFLGRIQVTLSSIHQIWHWQLIIFGNLNRRRNLEIIIFQMNWYLTKGHTCMKQSNVD